MPGYAGGVIGSGVDPNIYFQGSAYSQNSSSDQRRPKTKDAFTRGVRDEQILVQNFKSPASLQREQDILSRGLMKSDEAGSDQGDAHQLSFMKHNGLAMNPRQKEDGQADLSNALMSPHPSIQSTYEAGASGTSSGWPHHQDVQAQSNGFYNQLKLASLPKKVAQRGLKTLDLRQ